MHVPELQRHGSDVGASGNTAVVQESRSSTGASVMGPISARAHRYSLAGLVAEDEDRVRRVYIWTRLRAHRRQGRALSANVTRVKGLRRSIGHSKGGCQGERADGACVNRRPGRALTSGRSAIFAESLEDDLATRGWPEHAGLRLEPPRRRAWPDSNRRDRPGAPRPLAGTSPRSTAAGTEVGTQG